MAAVPPDRRPSDELIAEELHRREPHKAGDRRKKLVIQGLAQQIADPRIRSSPSRGASQIQDTTADTARCSEMKAEGQMSGNQLIPSEDAE